MGRGLGDYPAEAIVGPRWRCGAARSGPAGALTPSNCSGFFTLFGMQCTANAQPSPFTTNAAEFNLYLGGWWPRALSPVEALALSADPFGLIRPRPFYAIADDSQNANAGPGVSTWAVPAPTVTTQVSAAPAPAVATWSVPTPQGQSNVDGTPTSAVAAWYVLTPTTSLAATANPAPAVAMWQVPGALGVGEDADIAFSGQVYPA